MAESAHVLSRRSRSGHDRIGRRGKTIVTALFPYQEDGARFIASLPRAGLFDEPGIGKTAQAIRAADLRGARRGWVICPAIAREHWKHEFANFGRLPRRVIKAETHHDFTAWCHGRFDVLVASYEMATKWSRHLDARAETLPFAILDEGHYLKDPNTKRSKALLGVGGQQRGAMMWAEWSAWLTGTAVPNSPADIFTFLRYAGAVDMAPGEFERLYFHIRPRAYSSALTVKPTMAEPLRQLIGRYSLRRVLADTGMQLPPIWITTQVVDGDTSAVRDLLLAYPGIDEAIRLLLSEGHGLSRLDADHIATLRRLIGEAKALPYAAMLRYELTAGGVDKMVTFGLHRQALATVHQFLTGHGIDCVLVNGSTSEADRVAAQERFRNDPTCRVFLANIRAAGTALTLT
ncbi:MAG: DEAD/DEAH box helicase, partial [Bradyrhizobium sp.]|nr:DEAD/DEAH box helicase [Bradyrhizobium sp.]